MVPNRPNAHSENTAIIVDAACSAFTGSASLVWRATALRSTALNDFPDQPGAGRRRSGEGLAGAGAAPTGMQRLWAFGGSTREELVSNARAVVACIIGRTVHAGSPRQPLSRLSGKPFRPRALHSPAA